MALTTEKVALWKRNADVVKSYATDMEVKILQDRIIELADEVLACREAPPTPAVPEEMKRDPDADVFDPGFMNGWNACRAAMLGGAK